MCEHRMEEIGGAISKEAAGGGKGIFFMTLYALVLFGSLQW